MLLLLSPYLSDEIVHNILLRLPVKTLLRFKAVSKLWYALITDPQFAKWQIHWATSRRGGNNFNLLQRCGGGALYFERSKSRSLSLSLIYSTYSDSDSDSDLDRVAIRKLENPFNKAQDIQLLGSCNGLLLVCLAKKDTLLWNPCTREIKKLPLGSEIPYSCQQRITGLAYNSSLDEYKAIMAYRVSQEITLCVCSFKAGSYSSCIKYLSNFPYCGFSIGNLPGVTVNGSPHWVMSRKGDIVLGLGGRTIVCFDVEEESFREVSGPDSLDALPTFHVTVLGGSLCVAINDWCDGFAVWAMKEYGVKESWTKLFNIPIMASSLNPLAILSSSEVLICVHGDKFMIFNFETGKEDYIYSSRSLELTTMTTTYVESLVSPGGRRGGMIWPLQKSVSVANKRRKK